LKALRLMSIRLILVCSLIMSFFGCSKNKSSTKAEVVISFGSLVGATFPGGAVVQLVNETTREVRIVELVAPYNVTIPYGEWGIYFVGFEGSKWQGPHACGGVSNYLFEQEDQTVEIKVTEAQCAVEPYLTLKNYTSANAAKWDFALWDMANWE
jgi:hypothetical protein